MFYYFLFLKIELSYFVLQTCNLISNTSNNAGHSQQLSFFLFFFCFFPSPFLEALLINVCLHYESLSAVIRLVFAYTMIKVKIFYCRQSSFNKSARTTHGEGVQDSDLGGRGCCWVCSTGVCQTWDQSWRSLHHFGRSCKQFLVFGSYVFQ